MNEQQQERPFKHLGVRLQLLRKKMQESTADVSGAVEIDESVLQQFELGSSRPSEEILMLLISHFGMREDEAASLWQLAGYEPHEHDHDHDRDDDSRSARVLVMAVDPRIIYSDGAQVTANQQGVVLNFSQGNGTQSLLLTARVGMSREQARALLDMLQQALQHSEPKQLPAGPATSASEAPESASSVSDSAKDEPSAPGQSPQSSENHPV